MCKYRDCDFYIPIDVVKGIDHAHGDVVVMGDDEIDDAEFVPAHKCKFCSHYQASEKNMGICSGFETEYWAFAENGACNCEAFEMVAEAIKA